jgi:cytochrome c556
MSDRSCVDAVVEMLDAPDLWTVAASSPAVRMSLQGLLRQVNDEIEMLAPFLDQQEPFDREQLAAVVAGRREIVERLRTLLIACGGYSAP